MKVNHFSHPVSGAVADKLESFEHQFTYPLGPADTFSISHGKDYLSFFAAMGSATLLVAEDRGEIAGTMVLVRRQLAICQSAAGRLSQSLRDAHYLCDLKVRPDARSSFALFRLLQAAADVVRPHASHSCYGIVMTGTSADPAAYSGRLGIPKFTALADVAVIRFMTDTSASDGPSASVIRTTPQRFEAGWRRLHLSGIQVTAGEPLLRSLLPAEYYSHVGGTACGMLEDTRRGKRLYRGAGEEMVSAHLSCLGWTSAAAAAEVIQHAVLRSCEHGYPAMFCSMPLEHWAQLKPSICHLEYYETSATVFGYELPRGLPWWVNTSEI